jgi:hypothetical protein
VVVQEPEMTILEAPVVLAEAHQTMLFLEELELLGKAHKVETVMEKELVAQAAVVQAIRVIT